MCSTTDTTMWQSGACFPNSYVSRPDMNGLYWRCNATSACTASAGSTNLYGATDGRTDIASASIARAADNAWLRVSLPTATTVTRLALRGVFPASNTSAPNTWLFVVLSSGAAVQVMAVNGTASYQLLAATGSWSGAVALLVNSSAAFSVSEVAAQQGPCFESATVDLGSVQDIGSIR